MVNKQISIRLQVVASGSPVFNYKMDPDNTCVTPAHVRAYFERNDDQGDEFYRWWANPTGYELAPDDVVTLTTPLTPDQWSSVYGKVGNYDASSLAGFQGALANVGQVGMAFGGGCFFGHGVNVSGGTAQFILLNFAVE